MIASVLLGVFLLLVGAYLLVNEKNKSELNLAAFLLGSGSSFLVVAFIFWSLPLLCEGI